MQSTPRTSGIRLPWSSAGANTEAPADAAAETVAASSIDDGQTDQSEQDEKNVSSNPPEQMTPPPSAAGSPTPDFLADLVAAMRSVVEASRDRALAELRTAVESGADGADASTVERQAQLRTRADAEIAGIGDWERGEIDRVRTEATRKVATRRQLLDQELAEQDARRDAERAALQAQVADYERRLGAFMDELTTIKDPAAFAAAARRMPSPPSVGDDARSLAPPPVVPPTAPTAPPQVTPALSADSTPVAIDRLAELDVQLAEERATEAAANTTIAATASSTILVRGLGSFGAITSFKQALQRANGISSVALGIGSTGEFIFNIDHEIDFDMLAAVRSIEPDAEIQADGSTVAVKVARTR
ncbi:MAG: hypothetical protein ABIQ05_08935 [Candidatus Limnocylindria bacterium]